MRVPAAFGLDNEDTSQVPHATIIAGMHLLPRIQLIRPHVRQRRRLEPDGKLEEISRASSTRAFAFLAASRTITTSNQARENIREGGFATFVSTRNSFDMLLINLRTDLTRYELSYKSYG